MSFRTGISATALLNATELPVTGWGVPDASAVVVPFINSKTGIHPVKATTFIDSRFYIDLDWDDANQPFTTPLSIVPGLFLTNVKLLLDGAAGIIYASYPSAVVRNVSIAVNRAGKIVTRLDCEASGSFGLPGGAVQ